MNPKRPCGHTKITGDCPACADRLLEALAWSARHPVPTGTLRPAGSVMQTAVDRYEENLNG